MKILVQRGEAVEKSMREKPPGKRVLKWSITSGIKNLPWKGSLEASWEALDDVIFLQPVLFVKSPQVSKRCHWAGPKAIAHQSEI